MGWQGCVSLEALRGNPFLCFFQLLEATHIHSMACGPFLYLQSQWHGILFVYDSSSVTTAPSTDSSFFASLFALQGPL